MRGLAVGSAERSITLPRLFGLSTQQPNDSACAVGTPTACWCSITEAVRNCTSGASRPSRVRKNAPVSPPFELSSPLPSASHEAASSAVGGVNRLCVSVYQLIIRSG